MDNNKSSFQYAVSYDCPNTTARLQTMWYDSIKEAKTAMVRFRKQNPRLVITPAKQTTTSK
jgi:hypothetical protein